MYIFEIVMHNLVFNAIKFTHAGGSISIAAKPVADDMVEFSICDSGIGMDETMADTIVTIQIRQFNKDVIIIAQTAFGFREQRENSIKAGCNDFIAKPIYKNLLLALIQKHFSKKPV